MFAANIPRAKVRNVALVLVSVSFTTVPCVDAVTSNAPSMLMAMAFSIHSIQHTAHSTMHTAHNAHNAHNAHSTQCTIPTKPSPCVSVRVYTRSNTMSLSQSPETAQHRLDRTDDAEETLSNPNPHPQQRAAGGHVNRLCCGFSRVFERVFRCVGRAGASGCTNDSPTLARLDGTIFRFPTPPSPISPCLQCPR